MSKPKTWYAVKVGRDDRDYNTGSTVKREALKIAKKYHDEYPDEKILIAVCTTESNYCTDMWTVYEPKHMIYRYTVTYNDKKYTVLSDSAENAIEKFSNRKVYGRNIFFGWRMKMVDADTRGVEWCLGETKGEEFERSIYAERQ